MTELDVIRDWINEQVDRTDKSTYNEGYNDALFDVLDMLDNLEDKLEHS